MSSEPQVNGAAKRLSPKRLLPLLVLAIGLGLFFAFGLGEYLSIEALQEHREWLKGQIDEYGLLANLVFVALYVLAITFSVPGGSILTIVGGFLFGTLVATITVVIGATIGATCLFLVARYALYDMLHAKAGAAVQKMEHGFKENAFNYLLVLRLVPLFPFWLVNLVPALLGVPLKTYVLATAIGIVPGTFVYASVGNGAGEILAAGGELNLAVIFEPHVLVPILGLAVLALIPVFYKAWKARKDKAADKS